MEERLLLGILQETSLNQHLEKSNPYLVSYFTEGKDYLQKFSVKGKSYLGKPLPSQATLEHIYAMETHILSLLKKIVPSYPFTSNPLVLLSEIDE